MLINDLVMRRLRAAYYQLGFLRRLPIGERIARAVQSWEEKKGKGDSPKAKDAWERQFNSGEWEYMSAEVSRYAVIVGYLEISKGEILDVGCGQGFLFRKFRPYGYMRYVGVDISDAAIARLQDFADERTHFAQGDGDQYEPLGSFDSIVFNESLYYLRHPIDGLKRYANALKPLGVLIVSNYTASRRARALLRDAEACFNVIDETVVRQGKLEWRCVVLRP